MYMHGTSTVPGTTKPNPLAYRTATAAMPVRPSRQGPRDSSSLFVFFRSYQTEHARKGKEAVSLSLFLFLFVAVLLRGAAGGARLAQLAAMRGTVLLVLVMGARYFTVYVHVHVEPRGLRWHTTVYKIQ